MGTINFLLQDPSKPGERTILLIFQNGKEKFRLSTGQKILVEYWDNEKKRVTRKHPNSVYLNGVLADLRAKVEKSVLEAKQAGKTITKDILLIAMGREVKPEVSFETCYLSFIRLCAKNKQPNTIKNYQSTLNSLVQFAEKQRETLCFEKMNETFWANYCEYLSKSLQNNNITVDKKLKTIQVFLKYAEENNWYDMKNFRKFRFKAHDSSQKVALTEAELLKLYEFPFPINGYLDKARDLFCFAAFSGLRFSDIVNFKPEQFITIELETVLNIVNSKTRKEHIVPFHPNGAKILKKYNNELPKISNQKLNEYIKLAAKQAEINTEIVSIQFVGTERLETKQPKYELITVHTARRTYITMLLQKGVPAAIVQAAVGHASITQTMEYFDPDNSRIVEEIKKSWK